MKRDWQIAAVLLIACTLSCPGVAGDNSHPVLPAEPKVNATLTEKTSPAQARWLPAGNPNR